MKKIGFYIFFWFLFLPWVFLNYGYWIDATDKPIKSDVIFCLGGGTVERLNKSAALYYDGYSKSKILILLGESYNTKEQLKKTYPLVSIVQHHEPKNTKEEVLYIKKYMVQQGYTTALIITDPPHSRRVKVLDMVLSVEGENVLSLSFVSSEVQWWEPETYYNHKQSGETVLSETVRILYSILCYGILERLGIQCE